MIRCGDFFFRYRNAVFPVFVAAIVVIFPPRDLAGSVGGNFLFDVAFLGFAFAGQALRFAVVGLEYIKRGGVNKRIHADKLVTGGMFGHCRNPLYIGNLLILLSILLINGNPWAILIGVSFFLFVYGSIVVAEERFLRAKFGAEYEAYCERVNRWLPDFRGLGRTLEGMRFNWQRVVLKEYGSVYAWVTTVIALEAYEIVRNAGLAMGRPYLTGLAITWAVATALMVFVRVIKKKRILRDPSA